MALDRDRVAPESDGCPTTDRPVALGKVGQGRAAWGRAAGTCRDGPPGDKPHTWMLNWARSHGRSGGASEVVSTGTCTGHCFAAHGDVARAGFRPLASIELGVPMSAPRTSTCRRGARQSSDPLDVLMMARIYPRA